MNTVRRLLTVRPGGGLIRSLVLAATAVGLSLATASTLAQEKAPKGEPRAASAGEKLPKGEQVLDDAIEARGGKAAFEKVRTRVMKGTIEMSFQGKALKGTIESYAAAPNKEYVIIEMDEPLGEIESGTDGEVFWELSGQEGLHLIEGEAKAVAARESCLNGDARWRELYKSAECVGVQKVGDQECFKVVLTPKEGAAETAYFDRDTHLPVKRELILPGVAGSIPIEDVLSDYRKVGGVLMPFKKVQTAGGIRVITYTFSSIEDNVEIPAKFLELPKKAKKLAAESKSESKPAAKPDKPGNDEAKKGEPKKDKPKKDKP